MCETPRITLLFLVQNKVHLFNYNFHYMNINNRHTQQVMNNINCCVQHPRIHTWPPLYPSLGQPLFNGFVFSQYFVVEHIICMQSATCRWFHYLTIATLFIMQLFRPIFPVKKKQQRDGNEQNWDPLTYNHIHSLIIFLCAELEESHIVSNLMRTSVR